MLPLVEKCTFLVRRTKDMRFLWARSSVDRDARI